MAAILPIYWDGAAARFAEIRAVECLKRPAHGAFGRWKCARRL